MCGRFTQERPASELADIFAAEPLVDDPGPRYNVAPTDEVLVVVQREERRAITSYRWGLVPHWSADLKTGSRMFNARAETLTTSPAFRDAFKRRRCLVPAESFYEWKREGSVRQPYRVVREDGRPLVARRAVGGLEGSIDRTGPAHLHDRDHDAERGDGRPPRSDARRRPGRCLGALAASDGGRARRAAGDAPADRRDRPSDLRGQPRCQRRAAGRAGADRATAAVAAGPAEGTLGI